MKNYTNTIIICHELLSDLTDIILQIISQIFF